MLDAHADRMLAALGIAGHDDVTTELRDAVCEYVAHLKAEGLAAEQVVIRVKHAIAHAGRAKTGHAADPFVDQLISLCIREFYKR